jgi:hypothetical protein
MHSLYLPLQEVHADCLLVVFGEGAFAIALDHTGLAHGSVPNDHHLWTRPRVRSHSILSYININKAQTSFEQFEIFLGLKTSRHADIVSPVSEPGYFVAS